MNNQYNRGPRPVRNTRPAPKYGKNRKRKKKNDSVLYIAVVFAVFILAAAIILIFVASNGSGKNEERETAESAETRMEDTTEIPGVVSAQKIETDTAPVESSAPETEPYTEPAVTETSAPETEPVTADVPDTAGPDSPEQPSADADGLSSKGYPISIRDGVTYVDGILIANKSYPLPSDYGSGLTAEMNSALESMFSAASKDGINLHVVSGFRSYSKQKTLYTNYCNRDGKAAADTYSARPGYSEHQTGLAADINSVETSWGNTAEGKWLAANCYRYGFIIRYPEGKESKTGYQYEPWHVRYLGVETATSVYNSGLCLEEYLGIDSEYKD